MSSRPERLGWILVAALLCSPMTALAWGETGHRVVCQIAYDELRPAARKELDRLLALDPDFDRFADACLFADEPERIRWQDHFMNLPRSATAVTVFDCPLADTCVVQAIHSDFLQLLDPATPDADKLLALKLLGHWVGDIHQPMHVSFQDDRGANSIRVDRQDEEASLHRTWDYDILSHALGDKFRRIAGVLRRGISDADREAWRHDSPVEWANESFQVTISPAAGYCRWQQGACWYSADNMLLDEGEEWRFVPIDEAYLDRHGPTVVLRLKQAGIRLAELLNRALVVEQ